ncbi:hypothetical protein [Halalkalicoccus sp. NIPERK01]|uniref:hypothetical protein n=1 Tax=Halalkalicoccus sp. NIPERK01 TaxID=3053469 RepID=UPI00256EB082|nr:hypothetical protein [Halalkalicoccus sp. NIPERK01]MDL5361342.1 hypothetical protein [Halalkalicoccus sp. NIPERK01]
MVATRTRTLSEGATAVSGRIGYLLYDIDTLRRHADVDADRWHALDPQKKLQIADEAGPLKESWTSNLICIGMDRSIARTVSQGEGLSDTFDAIAVGTSDVAPEYTNETINDELDRSTIATYDRNDTVLTMRAFFDTNQANTTTAGPIVEAGTVTNHGHLANHALTNSVEKSDQEGLVMVAEFTFDSSGGSS